jgi:uncharacterized protein (TIGR02594 family)
MTQPRWLALAWGDLGVAETPGADHTRRVVRYYADVGHAQIEDDETAWCAAFLGACLERAGIASTRSLMARSYLSWGEPLHEFRPGAVAVLSRTADPALGHAGFLIGETAGSIILLGGNQSDAVTVEAFPRSRLLGLRWPSSVVIPEGAPAPIRDPEAEFNRALAHVLEMEGGWTDDPYDPGGPTNFGITLATYARDKGIELTAANIATLKAELKSIPAAVVRRIYRDRYWQPASCTQMSPALGFFHFDAAVNQGVTGAARLLQEAVGAEIDGEIGPETLAKAAAPPIGETLALYADARRRHYRSLATFWRFGRGWLTRVDRTLEAATEIVGSSPPPRRVPRADSPPHRAEGASPTRRGEGLGVGGIPTTEILHPTTPSQPKEKSPMIDTTQPAATPDVPDTKWWGQSMTIWGVIITTLSTVLPAFGPLLGLDITAELIRQLGDQIVVIVQAVGGLIGTILTIWGRARATTTLERKQITMNM